MPGLAGDVLQPQVVEEERCIGRGIRHRHSKEKIRGAYSETSSNFGPLGEHSGRTT